MEEVVVLQLPTRSIYSKPFANQYQISIDLSSANYHALRYVNANIVLNSTSYAHLLELVFAKERPLNSDANKRLLAFIASSKHFRQGMNLLIVTR